MTRIYPWSGNGPMKSIFRHSIGVYVEVVKPCAWIGIFSIFIFWQHGQWSMKYLICCRWYSQVSFVYRDANNAKQKQNQMSACLQLNTYEGKLAMSSDVGWLSAWRLMSACRWMSAWSSVDDFSRYPTLAKKTPIDKHGWDDLVGRLTDFGSV